MYWTLDLIVKIVMCLHSKYFVHKETVYLAANYHEMRDNRPVSSDKQAGQWFRHVVYQIHFTN